MAWTILERQNSSCGRERPTQTSSSGRTEREFPGVKAGTGGRGVVVVRGEVVAEGGAEWLGEEAERDEGLGRNPVAMEAELREPLGLPPVLPRSLKMRDPARELRSLAGFPTDWEVSRRRGERGDSSSDSSEGVKLNPEASRMAYECASG